MVELKKIDFSLHSLTHFIIKAILNFTKNMGIKHLKNLLSQLCKNSGIHHYPSVDEFVGTERNRIFREMIKSQKINNPIKQLQIKKSMETKPYFVGIDAHLYASRYKRVFKKIEYGFFRQIMVTLSSKMIPIYIFDGFAPQEKRKTIMIRQNKKEKLRLKLENLLFKNIENVPDNISDLTLDELLEHVNNTFGKLNYTDDNNFIDPTIKKESNVLLHNNNDKSIEYAEFVKLSKKSVGIDHDDIQNFKNFLDLLKIPYVTANREADDLMAFLYKNNVIQACQSDDMDMLPKGCGNVIQVIKNGILQYILPEILSELQLNHNQFVDLCILLGSDYCISYTPKIEPLELYNKFKQCSDPCIENFIQFFSEYDPKILLYMEEYKSARTLFFSMTEDSNLINKNKY